MSETSNEKSDGGLDRKESLGILMASLLAAVSTFAVTVIAQRSLSPAQNTEFLLFWSLLFGIFGIIVGIQQETTRAVGAANLRLRQPDAKPGARVLPISLIIGAMVATTVALSSGWWATYQVPSTLGAGVLLIAIGTVLYAAHSAMIGASAGREQWSLFAKIGGLEAIWRLVAMVLAALMAGTLLGLEIAVVSACFAWLVLVLLTSEGRRVAASRADVPNAKFVRNVLFAMGSSTAAAVLTVAFPTLLKWSLGQSPSPLETAALGVLILAISITRSPIMIPLQAFQGVAISSFLKQRHRPLAAMLKPAVALLGVGALGAIAAWLIGPWLFSLLYERKEDAAQAYDMVNQGWVLGGLTFASAIMALLVLSGTATIALNAHRLYVVGWVTGAVVSGLLIFLLPYDLVVRSMVSLYVGPFVGFLIHLAGMVGISRFKATNSYRDMSL